MTDDFVRSATSFQDAGAKTECFVPPTWQFTPFFDGEGRLCCMDEAYGVIYITPAVVDSQGYVLLLYKSLLHVVALSPDLVVVRIIAVRPDISSYISLNAMRSICITPVRPWLLSHLSLSLISLLSLAAPKCTYISLLLLYSPL